MGSDFITVRYAPLNSTDTVGIINVININVSLRLFFIFRLNARPRRVFVHFKRCHQSRGSSSLSNPSSWSRSLLRFSRPARVLYSLPTLDDPL
jgi:hypothetical protein